MQEHAGQVALVTGASRNIGRGIAEGLGRAGAHVLLGARTRSADLEASIASLADQGLSVTGFVCDLGMPAALDSALEDVMARHGRVDILVNNAVARGVQPFEEIGVDDWDRMQRVNLLAPLLLMQRVVPGMRAAGGGRIVNISGLDAFRPWRGRAHFNATKMGLVGLTRSAAVELATSGITVNTVVPGALETERGGQPEWLIEELQERRRRTAMGRLGAVEDVVAATLFLCSAAAGYITGQELCVTGGP